MEAEGPAGEASPARGHERGRGENGSLPAPSTAHAGRHSPIAKRWSARLTGTASWPLCSLRRERRDALFALYAFNVEIARVREAVREPLAGEIRLQWWSDVLAGGGMGEIEAHRSHPPCCCDHGAPSRAVGARLQTTIAARRFDLYDEPMVALADLEGYAQGASSSLIALAAKVLNGARWPRYRRAQPSRRTCLCLCRTAQGVSLPCRARSALPAA